MRRKRRQTLEYELLALLKTDGPTHRTALHTRFDTHRTVKLNPVLLALETLGLLAYAPDSMVTITESGLVELDKRVTLVTTRSTGGRKSAGSNI
jgi:DNA-binding PadR family transcriptional regulator